MKFNRQARLSVACLCLAAAQDSAWAGRPLATEDAGVLESRSCEWENTAASTRQSGASSIGEFVSQLGCGVGMNTQVAVAMSRAHQGGLSERSLGLLGKTGLIAGGEDSSALTLAWGLVGFKPEGASLKHDLSFLNLVATRSLGSGFTGHANLGLNHRRSAGESTVSWNLALEWAQRDGLEWMGEVYGAEHSKPWLGLGVRWAPSQAWAFYGSVATQSESPRVRLMTLGIKLSF